MIKTACLSLSIFLLGLNLLLTASHDVLNWSTCVNFVLSNKFNIFSSNSFLYDRSKISDRFSPRRSYLSQSGKIQGCWKNSGTQNIFPIVWQVLLVFWETSNKLYVNHRFLPYRPKTSHSLVLWKKGKSSLARKNRKGKICHFRTKMDFSGFGDDNWEVKKWLNSAFVDVAKDKRDAHAAALLTKLQLVSQDIARYDF